MLQTIYAPGAALLAVELVAAISAVVLAVAEVRLVHALSVAAEL